MLQEPRWTDYDLPGNLRPILIMYRGDTDLVHLSHFKGLPKVTYHINYIRVGENFGTAAQITTPSGEVIHETEPLGLDLYGALRLKALRWILRNEEEVT